MVVIANHNILQQVTPGEAKFQKLSTPNNKSYGLYSSPSPKVVKAYN